MGDCGECKWFIKYDPDEPPGCWLGDQPDFCRFENKDDHPVPVGVALGGEEVVVGEYPDE